MPRVKLMVIKMMLLATASPHRMGMVLAFIWRSSSKSDQSLGIFCPPISQKKSSKNKTIRYIPEVLGSTANTAAIAPEVLTAPLTNVRNGLTRHNRQ